MKKLDQRQALFLLGQAAAFMETYRLVHGESTDLSGEWEANDIRRMVNRIRDFVVGHPELAG